MGRSRDDCQTLRTRGLQQSLIVGDERNGLAQPSLQVEAAGKLDGVARAERMPPEERTCQSRDVRNRLDDGQGGKIALQGGQHPIATRGRERPSRARRTMPDATSTSESRLVAGIPDASRRRTVVLPASCTYRLTRALASK